MILRSVIAAIAGFILLVGVITTPLTPAVFSYLALAHSLTAAALAAGVFLLIGWVILDLPTALASTVLFALPALWLSQRALLSRPLADTPPLASSTSPSTLSGSVPSTLSGSVPSGPSKPVSEFYPPDRLLLWITALGVGFCVLIFGATADHAGGLPALFADQLEQVLAAIPELSSDVAPLSPNGRYALVAFILAITPASWMLSLAASLLFGQKLAERFGVNRRTAPDLNTWLLPPALDLTVLVLIALSYFSQGAWQVFWAALTICVVTPYFLLGLSVIHAIAKPMRGRAWVLVAVYFVLLSFLWAAIPVVILGLLESRWALRSKIGTSDNTHGQDENRS